MLGDLDGRFGLGRRCGVVVGVGDVDGAARGRDGAGGDEVEYGCASASADCGAPAARIGQVVSQFRNIPLCADGERQREAFAILGIPGGFAFLAFLVKGQVADRAGVGSIVRVFQRDLDWEGLVRVRCGGIRGGFDFLCHGERAGCGGRGIGIFEGAVRNVGSQQCCGLLIAGNGEGFDGWNQLAGAFCNGDGDRIERVIVAHLAARYRRRYLADGVGIRPGAGEGQVLEGTGAPTGDADFGWIRHGSTFTAGDLEGHAAIIDLRGIALGDFEPGERAGISVILVIAVDDGNGSPLSGSFNRAGGLFAGLTVDCGAPVLGRELCGFLHAPGGAKGQVEEGEGFAVVDVVGRFAACKFQLAGLCGGISALAGIGDFAVVSVVIQRDFQRVAGREARGLAGEVGYGLADLQRADARVGDDDGGFAAEQACEVIAAQIGFQRRRRGLKRRLRNMEPEPARFGAPAVAVRMGRVAHGAVPCKLLHVQRQLDRGFRGAAGQVRIPAAAGGLHAGGGDVGEAVVDGVVGGEGGHGGNQGAL